MAYDSLVLSSIINELNSMIVDARIEKVYQPNKTDILIKIHSPAGKFKLLLSTEARLARVNITQFNRENPFTPPVFCMVLRKHLEGGKITSITQPDFERIIHINVQSMDELGRLTEKKLICEIMGKHSNIILVDNQSGNIIDAISRFSHAVNKHREVLPGRSYVEPPSQGKKNPIEISEDSFKSLLWENAAGSGLEKKSTQNIGLDKWLLKSFTGLSPLTCKEIVYRTGLDFNTPLDIIGEFELQKLWSAFKQIIDQVNTAQLNPTLIYDNNGQVMDFSAVDLSIYNDLTKEHNTMNEIIDRFYQAKYEQLIFDQLKDHLSKVVINETSRNKKKFGLQKDKIEKAEQAEEYKIKGEVLTANLYMLEPYQKEANLPNYYDPEQKEITIQLDPSLTPSENAQAYFKKYTKAKAGRDAAIKLLKDIEQELNYLDTVATNIEQTLTLDDLKEIKNELIEQGYIKAKQDKRKKKPEKIKKQPLQFESENGWTILIGKNNKQNDWLTTKKAASTDTWLHVKDIPGSHVIIRRKEEDIPEATLNQAAMLAAYFSKARNSSNVPVDYTEIKHVHKPSGAKPGMVIYENQRTIFVTPPKELGELSSLKEIMG